MDERTSNFGNKLRSRSAPLLSTSPQLGSCLLLVFLAERFASDIDIAEFRVMTTGPAGGFEHPYKGISPAGS